MSSKEPTEKDNEIEIDNKRKKFSLREAPSFLKRSFQVWNARDPWRLSAVVAYYAILSLPGLLIIVINSVGAIYSEEIVRGEITGQIAEVVGNDAAKSVQSMLEVTQDTDRSFVATIISIGVLIFGATGLFFHLQLSLNTLWDIKQDPDSNILKFLIDRAISFGFVMVIGFLLLISFIISAGVTMLSDFLSGIWEPGWVVAAQVLDYGISTAVVTLLFALMFRFLPDARVRWATIWVGALVTAVLFNLGVYLLAYYFRLAEPGTVYGGAGSVVVILLWVSYACLILFFGAAMTRVYAENYGDGIHPLKHAMLVKSQEVILKKGKYEAQLEDME
jgi:membrane protein